LTLRSRAQLAVWFVNHKSNSSPKRGVDAQRQQNLPHHIRDDV
jgi:hypothetical protein